MRTADFDFDLPPELVAQTPALRRDQSRLLVLHRSSRGVEHGSFPDIKKYLREGDSLILNDSRVIPARLHALNSRSGGRFEILLVEEVGPNEWWVMLRPGRRAQRGTRITLLDRSARPAAFEAVVLDINPEGHRRLRFEGPGNILDGLQQLGRVPLPPYIARPEPGPTPLDNERYQTVFASPPGSVAAPTAGLHFTEMLLEEIRSLGVELHFVTLHIGLGTFAPVKVDRLAEHTMHEERYGISLQTADRVNAAKAAGRRVIAVGTTSLRVLESVAARNGGRLVPGSGRTRIFIYPPYQFRLVDALLTNFHLPRSTLLMLVSAFIAPGATAGIEQVKAVYEEAVRQRYRFFSYGDAMLIL